MTFLAIIIGIIILIFLTVCIWYGSNDVSYDMGIICGYTLAILFVIELIFICESVPKPYPEAMDVYQDKTTLEYTIRDGVKVDSVVVFKENYYGKN